MFVHQLIKVRETLEKFSNYEGLDLAYAIFKNKQLVDKKMMDLEFINNASDEIIEYESKRVELCSEFSEKDDEGRPIIEKELYSIKEENQEEFKSKMEKLHDEYKLFIEDRQKQIEMFNTKMNQVVDFEFFKLTKEQIPPQVKTASDLDEISFMIE